MSTRSMGSVPGPLPRSRDAALGQLFAEHFPTLVQLAALLVGPGQQADDIALRAFVDLRLHGRRAGDADSALLYLAGAVVRQSRSARNRASGPAPLPGEDIGPQARQVLDAVAA